MKTVFKKSAIAMAVAAFFAGGQALAQDTSVDTSIVVSEDESFILSHDANVQKDADLNLDTTADVPLTADSEVYFYDGEKYVTRVNEDADIDKEFNHETSLVNRDWNEDKDVTHDVQKDWDEDKLVDHDVNKQWNEVENVEHNVFKTWDEDKLVDHDVNKDHDETKDVNINVTDVEMTKKLSFTKDLAINGKVEVTGNLRPVGQSVIAVVDDKQWNGGNTGRNTDLDNEASVGENDMAGAGGNIGANVGAGDNNLQDNAAALAAGADAASFGMVDAEVFVLQDGRENVTNNTGVVNSATIGGNAMSGAVGNLGVNVASGNNNMQKNNMASAVGDADIAESSIHVSQLSHGNQTTNRGSLGDVSGDGTIDLETIEVTLTGPITGESTVVLGGDYAGSESGDGDFNGGSYNYQSSHDNIPNPDDDTSTQISWTDDSTYDLFASFTGEIPVVIIGGLVGAPEATNEAIVNGSVLAGAAGNIGANVAAGTGNMQSNSLSMAVSSSR